MARNEAFQHTPDTVARMLANRDLLAPRLGESVTFDFVKRDGTPSTLTGTLDTFGGSVGTEIVTLDTDKGPRSANLWTISNVR
jgi:hypothetical protein